MKLTVPLPLLVLLTVAGLSRAQVKTSILDLTNSIGNILPSLSRPANHSRIFYAVMFDAGSTGTRIHVYTFIHSDSEELPVLDNEMFHSMKPGLSAYADSPEMAGHTVRMLLKVAKKTVPRLEWKRTPLVLRATAGFRLLPFEKAQALLEQVQHVFDESPFLVPDNSVSIMNGTNEGILAWISLNYLTAGLKQEMFLGHLNAQTKKTVGILDLGGGSTQITFLPKTRKTIESVPLDDYVARFDISNTTFELYTYSYLGHGLMAARLAMLGALGAEGLEWRVFKSSCLPKKFRDEWRFGGQTYQVSGDPDVEPGGFEENQEGELKLLMASPAVCVKQYIDEILWQYSCLLLQTGGVSTAIYCYAGYKLCYQEVLKVVKGIIHQPYELEDNNVFYAFSYYFDRAVDAGLIDGVQGGMLEVRDFKKRAKEVCNKMTKYPPVSSFLCMDMTYITCLLKDGFGFKDNTVLQLTKKVNNVEASWALGATLDHFHNLKIH